MTTKSARTTRPSTEKPPQNGKDKALSFLAKLAGEFTAPESLPHLVNRVLELLRDEVGLDSCTVALRDEHNPHGLAIIGVTGVHADFQGLSVPCAQGLTWAAVNAGAPIRVPDLYADARVTRREERVRSGIYAPMIVQKHAIGVLSAHRSEVNAFTAEDLDLLTVVGRYLTGALAAARLSDRLRVQAATDGLTGLPNRRSFLEHLGIELVRSRRSDRPISIAILDLNDFKTINHAHGHAVGDSTLLRVAEVLTQNIRPQDLAARLGGDEFVLLLPETTPGQTEETIRRLRSVEIKLPKDQGGAPLGLSWGVAAWPSDGDSAEALLHLADVRLLAMKKRS
jgi:diguanylate cyclase (GGDEF)-like protein